VRDLRALEATTNWLADGATRHLGVVNWPTTLSFSVLVASFFGFWLIRLCCGVL